MVKSSPKGEEDGRRAIEALGFSLFYFKQIFRRIFLLTVEVGREGRHLSICSVLF